MNLRLLITEICNRTCEGCCNNDYNLDSLPKNETFKGYDKVIITGGEPMLFPDKVKSVIKDVRKQNPTAKIIMYTAKSKRASDLVNMLKLLDGITLTLHEQYDVGPMFELTRMIYDADLENKSLRLNVFNHIDLTMSKEYIPFWKIKDNVEYIKDCPIPTNEVFMQI